MIRSRFAFARPETIEEAAGLLAEAGGRGRVLGGGSVLVPALSAGLDDPSLIIDLRRLRLDSIRDQGENVVLGAGATYAQLGASPVLRSRLPLLAAMVEEVTGGPGLWNLATLVGSAVHANPASDAPGCVVALNASFRLVSVRGSRLVPATRFYRGPFNTERASDEIATELVVPAPPCHGRPAYLKLKGAASSWPIVTASCLKPEPGRIRLCLGAAATVPVLKEWPLDKAMGRIAAMAREAADAIGTEWADELAGPGYRRAVAGTMAERALRAVIGAAS